MINSTASASWFEEGETLPLRELADLSGLSEADVMELVDYGVLAPAEAAPGRWVFSMRTITVARTARRLREDFELETHGVALVLAYLDRIRDLEAELCSLRAQLPR